MAHQHQSNLFYSSFYLLPRAVISVCRLSVQAIIFEPFHTETSFLMCRCIFTYSRSSLSIKFTGSRSWLYEKNDHSTYFNMLIFCMWLQVINKVKVTHHGEGHIMVKVKISTSFTFYVIYFVHLFT